MRWFMDQFMKIAPTHRCDELCRATGPQIVCFDRADVFKPEAMAGGRFSVGRRKVFQEHAQDKKTWSSTISGQVLLESPHPFNIVPYVWAMHSPTGCDRAFLEILWPFTLYRQFPKNSVILGRLYCGSSKNKKYRPKKSWSCFGFGWYQSARISFLITIRGATRKLRSILWIVVILLLTAENRP